MANILLLDAFREHRVVEKLHGKALSLLDRDEKYAELREDASNNTGE